MPWIPRRRYHFTKIKVCSFFLSWRIQKLYSVLLTRGMLYNCWWYNIPIPRVDYVFVVRMIFNQRQVPGKFEKRQKKKFKVELSDVGFMYNTYFAKRLMLGGEWKIIPMQLLLSSSSVQVIQVYTLRWVHCTLFAMEFHLCMGFLLFFCNFSWTSFWVLKF